MVSGVGTSQPQRAAKLIWDVEAISVMIGDALKISRGVARES